MYSLKVCKRAGGENWLSHRGGKIVAAKTSHRGFATSSLNLLYLLENSPVTLKYVTWSFLPPNLMIAKERSSAEQC